MRNKQGGSLFYLSPSRSTPTIILNCKNMRKKSKKFEKKHSNIGAMQEEIRRGKVIFLGKFSD
jgi:hypothetical protein